MFSEEVIEAATAFFISQSLVYSSKRILRKRGKHRRGTYIPKNFNSRFSQDNVIRVTNEMQDQLKGYYKPKDFIRWLKRSKPCSN